MSNGYVLYRDAIAEHNTDRCYVSKNAGMEQFPDVKPHAVVSASMLRAKLTDCEPVYTCVHHGLTDLHDNHLTCFTDMLYSSMVPGNLPSQLEILSTGQNYYDTCV